jgi:hypothetical protein
VEYTDSIETDTDDVVQTEAEPSLTTIPVTVEGPTRTQELPAKASGMRLVTLTTNVPTRILGNDPRRKRAILIAFPLAGETVPGITIGTSRNEVTSPYSAFIPVVNGMSHQLVLTASDELWVMANNDNTRVSVIAEQWAN